MSRSYRQIMWLNYYSEKDGPRERRFISCFLAAFTAPSLTPLAMGRTDALTLLLIALVHLLPTIILALWITWHQQLRATPLGSVGLGWRCVLVSVPTALSLATIGAILRVAALYWGERFLESNALRIAAFAWLGWFMLSIVAIRLLMRYWLGYNVLSSGMCALMITTVFTPFVIVEFLIV